MITVTTLPERVERVDYCTASTFCGPLLLASVDDMICMVVFADEPERAIAQLKTLVGKAKLEPCCSSAIQNALRVIEHGRGDVRVALSGTPFQLAVWRELAKVERGETITYGRLSELSGFKGAARAVGTAMRTNRVALLIPCHRVVPSIGGVGQYAGGKERKRMILRHEGLNLN